MPIQGTSLAVGVFSVFSVFGGFPELNRSG